jgi:saccharopine dehydrogenase-like NADP-dependent oxidoreductase
MNVLLLGVGMQGKAALHDLCRQEGVDRIIAADADLEGLRRHILERGYGGKVACEFVDAEDPGSIARLMALKPAVAVDLLPSRFSPLVGLAAIQSGVHLVNTVYVLPEMKKLESEIAAAGLTFLPEFGMDPGIDLVLLGRAAGMFDRIDVIDSYGAGVPEPGADDNPLRYKVTWTFAGVLRAYMRGGRLVRDGRVVEVGSREMFSPENVHEVEIPGLGRFEAFANGDALPYAAMLGIDPLRLRRLGRYSFRWPGHCAFWKKLVDLRLLDDEPLEVDGVTVNKRNFLAAAIEPHIRLGPNERDVAVIRVDISGMQGGRRVRSVLQVVDYRDLASGFTAMNRTVGYTAAIGALMIADGRLAKRGLLSPLRDVPYAIFKKELAKRNIRISEELRSLE